MEPSGEPLLIVVGPTASGKTDLAVRVAERARGEIVSADSVQVYRGFDIGASKPTKDERARAPHHLVDIVAPDEPMDAARWVSLAESTIRDIRRRGRRPIVCGGTFLWVRALVFGLAPAPPGDEKLRADYRIRAEKEGRAALWQDLRAVDPESAGRLAPNDFVRVTRALEVYALTGVPLSRFHREHGFEKPRHPVRLVGVRQEPDELAKRIERRVGDMLARGWIREVAALMQQGFADTRPMASVGYRQIRDALASGFVDIDQLAEQISRSTRIFARRQRTWLRDAGVEWISPSADVASLLAQTQ